MAMPEKKPQERMVRVKAMVAARPDHTGAWAGGMKFPAGKSEHTLPESVVKAILAKPNSMVELEVLDKDWESGAPAEPREPTEEEDRRTYEEIMERRRRLDPRKPPTPPTVGHGPATLKGAAAEEQPEQPAPLATPVTPPTPPKDEGHKGHHPKK